MSAPVVVDLLPEGVTLPGDVQACTECCGWGFVWDEVAPGELRAGADCRACRGTGTRWEWA